MLNDKCPNCGKQIFFPANREFKCAYCSASLKNKNFMSAIVIAMIAWGALELSIILISDDLFAFVSSLIIGMVVSVLIFKFLSKIEIQVEKEETTKTRN